ncbi:alpha-amylase family glycosyl hydrolase [Cellulophaga sp. 20_2_10]|uniref:alpha-amylase family glycosyl hydrolase n=1 Tax=Cellulophaga sp. 20_2_10 TaxID=2942476 RepID=UPI00201B32D3|nr:alpha-amylase family glycosyl hydrolase [Cellulophaga sp. 20_2_10]MCL5245957.1 alpha-amylase family glycosyl hydrolase [Cellulophaga sp. 20_2_10]
MKKIIVLLSLSAVLLSCKEEAKKTPETVTKEEPIAVTQVIEDGVIYEANIRQYSPEGTFNAFSKDIPVLKKLGVKVIWVMPINPISKIKRKATGEKFTSEIENEEERKKYLGSYYSVSDYKAINPEFGSFDDFKNLVSTAHDNGILVIVDWVPNHTGWDHPWIKSNPEYYTQNEKGEIIDPINPETGESWGWTDVADLNYDNMDMRKDMIRDMKFWVEKADIDGYRMDVAHKVPVDFFDTAIKEMKTVKPIFMLAEAEQPGLLQNGFDMQYGWEAHHIFNQIAKGEASVTEFDDYMVKLDTILEADDINMNFVTNHDENSWNGTLLERMPNNKEVFTALTYVMPGMPLIYSGQEYDMEHRLRFFEKDTIPKTKGKYFSLLEKLGELKNTNSALNGGKKAANYTRVKTSNNEAILAFKREKGGETVYFIANLNDKEQEATIAITGEFTDYISTTAFKVDENVAVKLAPWEYHILVAKK